MGAASLQGAWLFVMHHHAWPSPRWEGKGWGWSRAQLPRLLPAVSQTEAQPPCWRHSLLKDSACFLRCYLRIRHSLWEPGPARSDSSFGVLTPHVCVIEKRKNKISCFLSPRRALHASELLAELGCALPWKGSRRKPLQLQP